MMLHRHFAIQTEEPVAEPVEKPKQRKKRRKRNTMGEKNAVFIATRNYYGNVMTPIKSLFANSDVDRVFLVIEDNEFPGQIPKEVEVINGLEHQYINPNGPNGHSHFSYLCVSRAAYGHILSDQDRVLALDSDLVVVDDISDIWDFDLEGNYCAGVPDKGIWKPGYCNMGVMLMDLKSIRDDGITDKMINMLNTQYYPYVDQDVLNACCAGKIKILPLRYNESPVTGNTDDPAIVHFVGVNKTGGNNASRRHYWNKYEAMTWKQVDTLRTKWYGKPLTW